MKIVRVIARLNVGGPAKHVSWLTAGLRGPDCESLLIAGTVPPGEEDMAYFAADLGVTPIFVPEMSREISPKDLLTVWKLFRLLSRERPDIVHTHTAKAGTVGRVAGLLYRWYTPGALVGRPRQCGFVHTYHGHIFHSYYGPLKTRFFLFIERALARLVTDRIIVVSEQQRREIHEVFGVGRVGQFTVIPLGLDTTIFADRGDLKERANAFRQELGAKPEDLVVGIVGRLTEIKNHELFLRAVSIFKEAAPQAGRFVRFVIIGDGALRNHLETVSRSLGLAEDVIFAGNRKDPENFYPALDIVALTSRNEGTPLTLIEAMANAKPVIATAVGGVVDLLGDAILRHEKTPYVVCERGISVPPDQPQAFAAGLARMISTAELRQKLGQHSLQFVTRNHSRERLLNDIKSLYGELVQLGSFKVKARSPEQTLESRVL